MLLLQRKVTWNYVYSPFKDWNYVYSPFKEIKNEKFEIIFPKSRIYKNTKNQRRLFNILIKLYLNLFLKIYFLEFKGGHLAVLPRGRERVPGAGIRPRIEDTS